MHAGLIRPLGLAAALLLIAAGAGAQQPADETALRYYAMHGQKQRAEAEARRLQALNPGWTMPEDVWTARPGQADETPFWALYAADDIDGLKRAIDERRRAEPGWEPSTDLARKLRRRELRRAVFARAGRAQWQNVADLAQDFGKGADVDDVELVWTVAEGFARSDRQPEAFALYAAILTRRSDPKERSATIQKAIGLLPMADVELLLAMGKTQPDGAPEFAALAIDITRGRISAILHDERKAAVDAAELSAFEGYARQSPNANEPGLVAWLALKQSRPSDALGWFKLAIARGGDAMIAHGLAHTLLRLGKRREAEEVAYAWREPLTNNAILFIDVLETDLTKPIPPAIEPDRLARYARVTLETRSGEGAQALAWYAYNACQFETALEWFRRAGAWMPKEGTVYGQALALQRLKRGREFSELVNRYDGLFPKVVALVMPDLSDNLPTPCDLPARARTAGPDVTRIAYAATPRVPHPAGSQAADPTLTMRRAGFPAAVSPENPLRFPELPRMNEPMRPVAQDSFPLVARRVGGVTAMPYEPYGFTLLPGWNGQAAPSDVAVQDRLPARGTLWAETRSLPPGGEAAERLPLASEIPSDRFRR